MDVYGTRKIELPRPELYVICPKEKGNLPEEITLSKEFFGIDDPDEAFVDVRVMTAGREILSISISFSAGSLMSR